MGKLNLKLPETLHQQLAILAKNEGVLLEQYILHALTRQAAFASMIQISPETEQELQQLQSLARQAVSPYRMDPVPEKELKRQQDAFQSLVQKLGQASPAEIESILATREQTEPEVELNAEVVARLQDKLKKQRTEADQQDLAEFSWQYAATIFPEDEEMVE